MTTLPHRQGCGPASRRASPRGARAIGRGAPGSAGVPPACCPVTCRSVSLRWGTRQPGTAGARPKQSSGVVADRAGWRSWARPCQCCATPALPGGLHSVTSSQQWRSIDLRHMNCSHVEEKWASPGAGDEGAAGGRVVGEGPEVPLVAPEGAGDQVGGGPQGEGQRRQRPGHQGKADPLEDLARQVRR